MERWTLLRLPVCLALTGLACGLSGVLWRRAWAGGGLPGCGEASACDDVLASRWSRVGGASVSAAGTLVYAGLVTALTVGVAGIRAAGLDLTITSLLGLAGGAAVWFTFLQLAVIRRFCPYCTAVHGLGIAAIVAWAWTPAGGFAFGTDAALIVGVGLAGLVGLQLLVVPRQYAVRDFSIPNPVLASAGSGPPPTSASGSSDGPLKDAGLVSPIPSGRVVGLLGGRLILTVDDWPRLGPADAQHVVACLFDYTCATCRRAHRAVDEAVVLAGGRLAVLLLPVPMDPTCNPHVTRLHALQAHACRYARLGMLVWQAAPGAYAAFDRWTFGPDEPPPLGLAMRQASELTGVAGLDPNRLDPAADALVTRAVAAYKSLGFDRVPALLLATTAITGEVASADVVLRAVGLAAAGALGRPAEYEHDETSRQRT